MRGEGLKTLARKRNGVLRRWSVRPESRSWAVALGLVRVENADLADAVSPKELDRAHLELAFALEATEALGAEAFGKRLESVPAGGDRASCAYWKAGQRNSK